MDAHSHRCAQLIGEAHSPCVEVEFAAAAAVKAGSDGRVTGPVVQSAQLLLEVVATDVRARIQLDRFGVDARWHRPQSAAEFAGDDSVEIENPQGERRADGQDSNAQNPQQAAGQRPQAKALHPRSPCNVCNAAIAAAAAVSVRSMRGPSRRRV